MEDHIHDHENSERMLPVAIVGRIMKQVLPANAKISKEAKETIQESATEFISFVTAEASDKCHKENRKTLNGDDICWSLSSLGFDNYADSIIRYLHKYRQAERERILHNQFKLTSSSSNSPSTAAAKLDKDSNIPQISNTQMPNLDKDTNFHQISTTQKPNLHKDANFQQISTTQKPNLDKDANFHQISTAHEKPNLYKDASFLQISATQKPFVDKDANFHEISTTQKPNLDKDANFHQILFPTQKQKTTTSQLEFRVLEKGNSSSFMNDS